MLSLNPLIPLDSQQDRTHNRLTLGLLPVGDAHGADAERLGRQVLEVHHKPVSSLGADHRPLQS